MKWKFHCLTYESNGRTTPTPPPSTHFHPLPNSPVLYRNYHLLHQHHPPQPPAPPGGVHVQPRLTLPGDVHKQRRVEPSWAVLNGAERKSYTQNKVEWNKTKMWKKAKAQKNKPHTNTHTHLPWPKVCGCGRATYLHICPYFCFAELSQKQNQTKAEVEVQSWSWSDFSCQLAETVRACPGLNRFGPQVRLPCGRVGWVKFPSQFSFFWAYAFA